MRVTPLLRYAAATLFFMLLFRCRHMFTMPPLILFYADMPLARCYGAQSVRIISQNKMKNEQRASDAAPR